MYRESTKILCRGYKIFQAGEAGSKVTRDLITIQGEPQANCADLRTLPYSLLTVHWINFQIGLFTSRASVSSYSRKFWPQLSQTLFCTDFQNFCGSFSNRFSQTNRIYTYIRGIRYMSDFRQETSVSSVQWLIYRVSNDAVSCAQQLMNEHN